MRVFVERVVFSVVCVAAEVQQSQRLTTRRKLAWEEEHHQASLSSQSVCEHYGCSQE